ncbi:MAG: class I SAM-dependent methyltransferase [Acidimicrobiia bacterium]|nr:MAG: class I SAM-dependent methyltransferase [Acidimicrobiia bacterium]
MPDPYDSAYYEELRPVTGIAAFVDRARDRLVASLISRHSPTGALLDVGCGQGDLLARFGNEWDLHGVERSEEGLRRARDRVPSATLAAADVQEGLPFPGPFEAITMVNVLEHLDRPEDALSNLAAAQAPGGVLVAHLPTIGTPGQARRYAGSYDSDPTHIFRPSGRDVLALIDHAGYHVVRFAWAPFLPFALWSKVEWQCAFLAVALRR